MTTFKVPDDKIQEPVEEVKEEEKKVELDEDGNPVENPDGGDGDGEEKKAPAWKATDYRWTLTDGMPRNLP